MSNKRSARSRNRSQRELERTGWCGRRWVCAVAAAVVLLAVGGVARAELRLQAAQVGFDGTYQVGRWTPVSVTLASDAPSTVRVAVETVDPDGCPTEFTSEPVRLGPNQSQSVRLLVRPGRLDAPFVLRLYAGDASAAVKSSTDPAAGTSRPKADRPTPFVSGGRKVQWLKWSPRAGKSSTDSVLQTSLVPLRQDVRLVLTLGRPAGLTSLSEAPRSAGDQTAREQQRQPARSASGVKRPVLAVSVSVERFPSRPLELDAVDTVVVAGQYGLSERQVSALRRWVEGGGHLLVAVGQSLPDLKQTPLGRWLESRFGLQAAEVSDLSGLEMFAERHRHIPFVGRVPATIVRADDGRLLVSARDGALLVRTACGFGQLTVLGLDLDRPPLSEWVGVPALIEKMLRVREVAVADKHRPRSQRLSHSGISDLASQLFAVQDYFADVNVYSSWVVMGLMALYLVVVGPLDYWLTHRVLKRPHWTWVTLPAAIVAAGLIFAWAARAGRVSQVHVNQLDLVDFDEVTSTTQTHSWFTVLSPRHARYQVEVRPTNWTWGRASERTERAFGPVVCWYGMPEKVPGGLYRPAGFDLGKASYRFRPDARGIDDLPVPVWSTKSLVAVWQHRSGRLVESHLKSTGTNQLSGTFTHFLPVPLEDWIVAYRNTVFRPVARTRQSKIPALPPGREVDLHGPMIFQRELRGYLTRTRARRVTREDLSLPDILVQQAKYDPLSRDPQELLQMLTFHTAAGGTGYTGLTNHTLQRLDFSPLLELDRAVLFGKISTQAAALVLNGRPHPATRQVAFVRLVMPVEPMREVLRELPELK